jgi:hypothetical protein
VDAELGEDAAAALEDLFDTLDDAAEALSRG